MKQSVLQHTTVEGERWDLIAHRYYGNALLIEGLIAANPHLPVCEAFTTNLTMFVPVLPAKPQSRDDIARRDGRNLARLADHAH